jgi:enterochelin esterase-like enzyme
VSKLRMKNSELATHVEIQKAAANTVLKNEKILLKTKLEREFEERVEGMSHKFLEENKQLKSQFKAMRMNGYTKGGLKGN